MRIDETKWVNNNYSYSLCLSCCCIVNTIFISSQVAYCCNCLKKIYNKYMRLNLILHSLIIHYKFTTNMNPVTSISWNLIWLSGNLDWDIRKSAEKWNSFSRLNFSGIAGSLLRYSCVNCSFCRLEQLLLKILSFIINVILQDAIFWFLVRKMALKRMSSLDNVTFKASLLKKGWICPSFSIHLVLRLIISHIVTCIVHRWMDKTGGQCH